MGKRSPRQVFINCPFDLPYEPLFLALVSGIVSLGCQPRCVLEVPDKNRLGKIVQILRVCGASFHDLSRIEATKPKGERKGLPRFNMPFEAGIAYALSEMVEGHSFFVLESERYRLQKTTSDLNGIDPLIHGGTSDGVLKRVKEALGDPSSATQTVPLKAMKQVARTVADTIQALRLEEDFDSVFDATGFKFAVTIATEAARAQRLIL